MFLLSTINHHFFVMVLYDVSAKDVKKPYADDNSGILGP